MIKPRAYTIEFLAALLRAKFFLQRTPFFVSWGLTYRCNNRCLYCDMPSRAGNELDFLGVANILKVLTRQGCRFLSFTGGEPLLREDIGRIIDLATDLGLCVKVNTNGSLVSQKAHELKKLSMLVLSFDGPEVVHDRLRGAGSYACVMEAVTTAKNKRIPVSFYTVLSSLNLEHIECILATAQEKQVKVIFQPATQNLYGSISINPVAPSSTQHRKAVDFLLKEKTKNNPWILNSIGGLRTLRQWPMPAESRCTNGLLGCRIEPDGQVRLCSLTTEISTAPAIAGGDFKNSFATLPLNSKCRNCWCASQIELNRMAALKWDAILNALNLF